MIDQVDGWTANLEATGLQQSGLAVPTVSRAEGQTDLSNSRRLKQMFGSDLRFCHAWNKWLRWDSQRWCIDTDGAAQRFAKSVADSIWHEAKCFDDNSALRWAAKSASSSGINAMLSLAQSEMPVSVDELDQNHWLLNCPNGTVDLRTGEIRDHRREDFITKLCPTEFDPDQFAPVWDRFQLDVSGGDAELVAFKQRMFGYATTGDTREQVLVVGWGPGGNGKSTECDAIFHTLGSDYCGTLPRSLLMVTHGERHPTELTTLHGKRLMIAHETDDGGRLSEALVKQLTGGDAITARGMRQDFWTFTPTHKLFMLTNHKPQVRGTDFAIWRRLKLVPYTVKFEGDRRDKSMPGKLRNEAAGILNWLIAGCLQWQQIGLSEPEAVTLATAEYRTNEDTLAVFTHDQCLTGPHYKVRANQLYEAYKTWCDASGERALTQRRFGEAMTERGMDRQVSGGTWYLGIGLRAG